MTDCPTCEYHKKRAQIWRDEAYRLAGHELPERDPVLEEREACAKWYEDKGWLLDESDVADAIRARGEAMTEEDDDIQEYKRPWVGLTDDEIQQLHTAWVLGGSFRKLCNSIEAKLKEKNT